MTPETAITMTIISKILAGIVINNGKYCFTNAAPAKALTPIRIGLINNVDKAPATKAKAAWISKAIRGSSIGI